MEYDQETKRRIGELRVGIVAARFNREITQALLDGAIATLNAAGVDSKKVSVSWVPGAFELPLMAQYYAEGRRGIYDVVICLGAVIRGGTPHFDYVCSGATNGMMQVSLKTGVPVIFGVLTTDTLADAQARACPVDPKGDQIERASHHSPCSGQSKMRNKGCEAAEAAIEMALLAGESE